MINDIAYNGIKVLSTEYRKTRAGKYPESKVLLLENGEAVTATRARKDGVSIRCTDCGELITVGYRDENDNKPYLCRRCSMSGERNPFFGRTHSNKSREKQSKAKIGKYVGDKNPMYGKNIKDYMTAEQYENWKARHSMPGNANPMYGKRIEDYMSAESYSSWLDKHKHQRESYSEEKRMEISKKLSEAQRRFRDRDPEQYSKIKARGGKATSSKSTKYQMTGPERLVAAHLKILGVPFDYSAIMGDGNRNFQYDFIVHGKRTLIEVDGDYWHANPDYKPEKPLTESQKKNIINDREKDRFAVEHNFKLIRIWESEIKRGDFSKIDEALHD